MSYLRSFSLIIAFVLVITSQAQSVSAFGFIFAEGNGNDIVTHASGYNGTGGVVNVSVGIDPSSANAAAMEISVQNVINTWNQLVPTTGNLISDFSNIPSGNFDFESVLLHELGHSLGLSHNNLGSQTGVSGSDTDFAFAASGADNVFTFDSGTDGVIGSRDDIRGDDVNLNYFRTSGTAADQNNPFTIDSVVDSTTYSRDLADLPVGDTFSGVASRQNATTFVSVPNNTEAVMNQGTFNNEIQRTLGHDDVAGIRYANSGLDSIAGTADDYTLNITYSGLDAGADIVIDFDNAQTGFAVSQSSGVFIGGNNVAITSNDIYFNDSFGWFFNQTSNATAVPEPASFAALAGLSFVAFFRRRRPTAA